MKNILVLSFIFIAITACKWFGAGNVVSNERISAELDSMKFKPTKGFVDWTFKEDANRCFKVIESKVDGDKAEMTLDLRATQLLGDEDVMVISGKLLVSYKGDGKGNWTMDKVESKDVEGRTITFGEARTTFAETAKPICTNYSDMPKYRKVIE